MGMKREREEWRMRRRKLGRNVGKGREKYGGREGRRRDKGRGTIMGMRREREEWRKRGRKLGRDVWKEGENNGGREGRRKD